jgi:hypothetical protein
VATTCFELFLMDDGGAGYPSSTSRRRTLGRLSLRRYREGMREAPADPAPDDHGSGSAHHLRADRDRCRALLAGAAPPAFGRD